MKLLLCLLALVFSVSAHAQKTTVQYRSIDGVDPELLSLDVYSSAKQGEKRPVVVWVHGGAWAIGSKEHSMADKVPFFDKLGYILVSVNYRLSPFPLELNNPDRLQHPTHVKDVAAALRWVYNNIDQFGGDRNKIAIMGHSAGAHLVALLATNQRFLADEGLSPAIFSAVISIDTNGYDIKRVIENSKGLLRKLYRNAFGDDPSVWLDASPIKQIEPHEKLPPNWLLFKRGSDMRITQSKAFAEKLQGHGAHVQIFDAKGLSHMAVNRRIGNSFDHLISPAIAEFLKSSFAE